MMEQQRSLIVFSDGTGNKGGVTRDTNVWRLYQMIDRSKGNQCTYYDEGLGTQRFSPIRLLSGFTGWGISKNIRQAYTFLVKNYSYERGDAIYLFGFSRGAFTVRSLLGMINQCGLVDAKGLSTEQIDEAVDKAFRAYRAVDPSLAQALDHPRPSVEFIGVWDTVDAVGLPFDELLHLIEPVYEKLRGKKVYRFDDLTISGARVARQAMAIDDERRSFHPNVWRKAGTVGFGNDPALEVDVDQVWFSGMHSNVGGGYPRDGLAYITLEWMLAQLKASDPDGANIQLHADAVADVSALANQADTMYDSRGGLASYLRYQPRDLIDLSNDQGEFYLRRFLRRLRKRDNQTDRLPIKVHASVYDRIRQGSQRYAPLLLPAESERDSSQYGVAFTALDESRWASQRYDADSEFPLLSEAGKSGLEQLIQRRQIAHYCLLAPTLILLIWGLFSKPCCGACDPCGGITQYLSGFLKTFVPGFLEYVVDNIFCYLPVSLPLIAAAVIAFYIGRRLKKRLSDHARAAWDKLIVD